MERKGSHTPVVGIAWYRPEDWDALKNFCEDWERMDPTYDDWKRHAEETLRNLRSQGLQAQPVDFDLNEFKMWCTVHGERPTGEARSKFVSSKVRDVSGK